jgi:hypothetical protein
MPCAQDTDTKSLTVFPTSSLTTRAAPLSLSILSSQWDWTFMGHLATHPHSVWNGSHHFLSVALLLLDPQLLRSVTQCGIRPLPLCSPPNTMRFVVSLPASPPASISRTCDQQQFTSTLYLYPLNDSFVPKHIVLLPQQRIKIGRQTNAKTVPGERNGYFDSKVLSRQHAEVWEQDGKVIPHLLLLSPSLHEVDLTL